MLLPLLYFAVGFLALPLAFAAVAFSPRSLAGFYYHPRLIGVVHLVTLGWITATILGAVYLALPLRLRMPLPVRRGDYWAFASFVIGLIGMVAHFWIGEFGGMAWSGLMVAVAVIHVAWRVIRRARSAPVPAGATRPIVLGFLNISIAAGAGVVIGFDKVHHFLPGYVLSNVLSHAHLAAIGWAGMMTIGLAYLVMPGDGTEEGTAHSIAATSALLEIAAVGLGATLLLASRWSAVFALLAGWAFFRFARDLWTLHRRQSRASRPRPDVGGWHVLQGVLYSGVTVALGVALAWMPASELTLRLALAYGVCGLVGFLAQCLMGIQMRLVPLAAGVSAERPCSVPAFMMWSAAVPTLVAGFLLDSALVLSVGGAAACVATVAAGVQGLFVVGPAICRPRWISWRRAVRDRRSPA